MPAIARGTYHEARFKVAPGEYRTIYDEHGKPVRYANKQLAVSACKEAEISYRLLGTVAPAVQGHVLSSLPSIPQLAPVVQLGNDPGEQLFADHVEEWIDDQDLADSTTVNYVSHIENHLLPTFGPMPLKDVTRRDVADWEKALRAAGYMPSSISTYRAVLHVVLEDACDAKKITDNPARRKRNRGRRAGRKLYRAPEKVITDARGALLIAERMALLSGRDDEFVAQVLKYYTGIRLGELVGLEKQYVADRKIRVEWQLAEIKGKLIKCPPKNDSRRDIHLPSFLSRLLSGYIADTPRQSCECHGLSHVFRGQAKRRSRGSVSGVTQRMIAQHAGVTVSTVSLVLRGCANVSHATRRRVLQAADELGYTSPGAGAEAGHWRRSGYYAWLYTPAVSGWYPKRGAQFLPRPVPVSGSEFPCIPVRGSNAHGRADGCWMPIAKGMTPHGNRHAHRTLLEELGTPQKLIDARIGHENSSVQATYTHVTQTMIDQLMDSLTEVWNRALDERLAMCPTSPVKVLNSLLQARLDVQHIKSQHNGFYSAA